MARSDTLAQALAFSSQFDHPLSDAVSFRGSFWSGSGDAKELSEIAIVGEVTDDRLNGTEVELELLGDGWSAKAFQEVCATDLEASVHGAGR